MLYWRLQNRGSERLLKRKLLFYLASDILGGNIDHAFLPNSLTTFPVSIFCTRTARERFFQNGNLLTGWIAESCWTHEGNARGMEEVCCMEKTGVCTNNQSGLFYEVAGFEQRSLSG